MRKGLAALISLVALMAVAAPSALAAEEGDGFVHNFRGTVASVDADAGTLDVTLKRKRCRRPAAGGDEPTAASARRKRCRAPRGSRAARRRHGTITVTILTDAETIVFLDGEEARLADLQPGYKVGVAIVTEEAVRPREALAQPAEHIRAGSVTDTSEERECKHPEGREGERGGHRPPPVEEEPSARPNVE